MKSPAARALCELRPPDWDAYLSPPNSLTRDQRAGGVAGRGAMPVVGVLDGTEVWRAVVL
jgi:hypothetical protein